jgi:hypothetical protein
VSVKAEERVMASERIAPGMLPRVLNSFDNYSFSRPLFVSGLERRMPHQLGTVNPRTKVPVHAIITQTVLSSLA